MSDIKVKLKVTAYEKGLSPTKVSQLENDSNYITLEEGKEMFQQKGETGLHINCGTVLTRKEN